MFKTSRKAKAHRIAYVSWEKFIIIFGSISKKEKGRTCYYMSAVTNEYQRLRVALFFQIKLQSILWNKKKVIKQGMNVPVSLRNVKPTGWWDEEKGDLTIHKLSEEESDSDEEIRPNKKRKRRKEKGEEREEREEIEEIEEIEEENIIINETLI